MNEIRPALKDELGLSSIMQVPRIEKITLNMGVGEAKTDAKQLDAAMDELTIIAGQRPQIRKATKSVAQFKIREGMPISVAMESYGLTTPVSLRMLRVGERTGRMGEMMERIARFYDDEIARWVDWFVRLFEPLLMAFIGVVIGGIVVMMYFPIFELAGSIQ